MKQFISNNKGLYITFTLAIITGLVLLILLDKGEGVLLANGNNTAFGDVFMKYYTHTGDGLFFTVVIVLLLLYKLRYGITALLSFGIASGGTQILKQLVFTQRYRPKGYFENIDVLHQVEGVDLHLLNSFPSGHTTTAFVMFTFFALMVRPQWLKALLILMATLTGLSRMYLAQHFLEDVVAGGAIGCIITSIIYYHMITKEKPLLNAKWLEYSILKK